jgi:cell shape-determining protein MreC
MAYLQDNPYKIYSKRRNPILRYIFLFLILIGVFLLFRKFFKAFAYTVTAPVLNSEIIVERGLYGLTNSKSSLVKRINELETQNEELRTKLKDYNLLENENSGFKNSVLNKSNSVLAAVVGKPGFSVYDTLLINVGKDVLVGNKAYTISGVPMGTITDASLGYGTVTLYSSPGVETTADIVLTDAMDSVSVTMRGRGGGGFEAIVPKDIIVPVGSLVTIPSLFNEPFAEVVKTVARDDTKDQVVYLRSIVNFQYLRYLVIGE